MGAISSQSADDFLAGITVKPPKKNRSAVKAKEYPQKGPRKEPAKKAD